MKNILSLFLILFLFSYTIEAQVETPAASPSATLTSTVGLTDVTIEYSRPGVKEREIFGDLVPYGKIWRAGANKATKVTFSHDVTIDNNKLEKGSYSLFIIPNNQEWTIIFNKDTELWGAGNYDESKDAARVKVSATDLNHRVETLTYDVNNIKNGGADLVISWDKKRVNIPFSVPTKDLVQSSIDKTMNGPSAADYSKAATYYYESGKNLDEALKWINKSVEMEPTKFWVIHTKAKILAKMGRNKEAIEAAEQSLSLAKEANYGHYIMLNEKLIEKLK